MSEQPAWRRQTEIEPRWHVSITILVMIALQITLAVLLLGAWLRGAAVALAAVELAAGGVLLVANSRGAESDSVRMRGLSLTLVVLASLANAVALIVLIGQLLRSGSSVDGARLLEAGGLVWLTNVIVFGLWFWELDRGGPAARATGRNPVPAFLFPQMTSPQMFPDWEPTFIDYLYVSWTDATAFSPTDTLPTSRWAKVAMMLQSGVSLVTAALVIARAVNTLG